MPVLGAKDDGVDYVIVRRTNEEGQEDAKEVDATFGPTATFNEVLASSNSRRQLDLSKLEFNRDDDDNGGSNKGPPTV